MRILMLNSYSTYGSTGNIMALLSENLRQKGHEVLVCYGSKASSAIPDDDIKVCTSFEYYFSWAFAQFTGFQGKMNIFSTRKIKKIIAKYNPDVVQLFNLHAHYVNDIELLSFLGRKSIPTVYTMFDEYAYMGKCCFSYECKKYITLCKKCPHKKDYPKSWFFDRSKYYFNQKKKVYDEFKNLFFVGCDFVYHRAMNSALLKNKHLVLMDEPVDYNVYYPRNTDNLRKKLGIPPSNIIVLTVARLRNNRKGGHFFLELAARMRGCKGYSFVYVGYDTEKYGHYDNIIEIPYVTDKNELCEYYSLADVFIFTSLADSSPSTILQALGSGSPVCAFNIEGISSMKIEDHYCLKLSPVGDIDALEQNVKKYASKDSLLIERCRSSVNPRFSIQEISDKYERLYERLLYVE